MLIADMFPTDVRLVLKGDKEAAAAIAGLGRSVLYRALELAKENASGFSSVQMRHGDGTIVAQIFGDIKVVTVTVPPTEAPEEVVPELPGPPAPPPPIELQTGLLSGWIRGPSYVTTGTPPVTYLRDYKPIPEIVEPYNLQPGFQDMSRLAQRSFGPLISGGADRIRPSSYSGAMKRVVQAMLGIGHVGGKHEMVDDSPRYIDRSIPAHKRDVFVTYSWLVDSTHGIYKADTKNHWLIEISRARGVLAMPLILMPDTTTRDYYVSKQKINDIGTLRVLDEFGGIPTGENFPTNPTVLEAAITAGKVLRLLGASDIAPFYDHKTAWSIFGWAFSDNGHEAHHCIRSDRDGLFNLWIEGTSSGPKYHCSEHWAVSITLSAHNRNNLLLVPPQPVGTGSATISMVHVGRMSYQALGRMVIPQDNIGMRMNAPPFYVASIANQYTEPPGTGPLDEPQPDQTGWGCIVNVFFDGNRMERLKWVPSWKIASGFREYVASSSASGSDVQGPFDLGVANYDFVVRESGSRLSPTGFAGDSLDLRTINRFDARDPNGDPGAFEGVFPVIWDDEIGALISNPSLLTESGGSDVFDESKNGHTISSIYYAIFPAYCRESYIIVESFSDDYLLTTWDWTLGIGVPNNLITEATLTTVEGSVDKRKTAAAFVGGLGRVNFFIDEQSGPMAVLPGNQLSFPRNVVTMRPDPTPSDQVMWSFIRDAGPGRQFCTHDGYAFLSDVAIEYLRVGLPANLDSIATPNKVNWIGTV